MYYLQCIVTIYEAIGFSIVLWICHLIPVLFIGLPIYLFLKHRITWNAIDTMCLVLPLVLWGACTFFHHTNKSFANVSEVYAIGISETLALLLRLTIGHRMNEKSVALSALCVLTLIAVSLWAFIPFMGD